MKNDGRFKSILLFILFLYVSGVLCKAGEDAIDVGGRLELFVDSYLIEKMQGSARLKLFHPVRREIAIVHDEPWEGSGCGYHTVFREADKYRMYYKAWDIAPDGSGERRIVIAYAESEDGIHWVKPNLGLVEFEGSKENNIILGKIGSYGCHDFSPFLDGNPRASNDRRYKAVGYARGLRKKGLFGFVSSDGIHWRLIKDGLLFSDSGHVFDTQNIAFWSDVEKQYVLYYRKWVGDVRSIARAVSKDFLHWKKEGMLDFQGRGPSMFEQFYTNQIRPYFRAPHIYIGFPARYVHRPWIRATEHLVGIELRRERSKTHRRYGSAVTDSVLISSRNGRCFNRWDEAFLRPGLRTRHNWAYGDNYIAWHVVETESGFDDKPRELSLYATESYFTDSWSRLRRYSLRLDGFGSIHASRSSGAVITKPIRFQGSELVLNFSTSAAGSIRMEIQDSAGRVIPRYSLKECLDIFGDSLAYSVEWRRGSDLGSLEGNLVRLRFVLQEADVYSFIFKDAAEG